MPWPFYVLIPVVIYLFYLSAKAAARRARERREALAALATRRGWSFSPDEDDTIPSELSEFAAFQQGHSQAVYNTLRGNLRINSCQYDVMAGDYTYTVTTSTGRSTAEVRHEFSYVVADCPFPRVPDLLIRRENFMDKLGEVIGLADINFESAEFSRKFYVKGPDRKFAYDVINPQMIEFLMASNPPSIELRDSRAFFGGNDCTWSPAEYDEQLEFVTRFFGLWPQYLLEDLEKRS